MSITTLEMYWLVMLDSINIGSAIMCAIDNKNSIFLR